MTASQPNSASTTSGSMALQTRGVGMSYQAGGQTRQVLHNIELQVNAGEFVCVLGPSGCGKSTLLNILAGFLTPSEGSVEADGKGVTGPDPRRILVFQERGVFPWLTVEENVGFGIATLPREEREGRIRHYIELVGLSGFERSYPAELSGGMKQRLEVARALAVNPALLMLDEPFSALDTMTRLTMRKELLRLWQAEQKTILFVTHDVDEAVQLADRIIVLSDRPATVQAIVHVDIPHPRDISAPEYLAIRDGIYRQIGVSQQV